MEPTFDLTPRLGLGTSDLARHFMECGTLNTNLSLAPGERLVITDDLLNGTVDDLAAISMAAVASRDGQVGRAAVIPLGLAAQRSRHRDRDRYERLFHLIEETAFDQTVRESADALIVAHFREARIRELVGELGGSVGPARMRYRTFLDTVRQLVDNRISQGAFRDEFIDFTRAVAGRLDFGIYSMCLDRLFASGNIPLDVKVLLLAEVLGYPPLVRKELLTNLLASPNAPGELVRYARGRLASVMTHDQIREVMLFTTLKLIWQSRKDAPDGSRRPAPPLAESELYRAIAGAVLPN
jgi:hypothetical protein